MSTLSFQVSGKNPSRVGGVGTSTKYFTRLLGQSLTSGQAATPNANNPAGALWLPVGDYDGQLFKVQCGGTFGSDTGDPSGVVTISLQAVTGSLAAPVYTNIASTTAVPPNYPSAQQWFFDVSLFGDSFSGLLTGYYLVMLGGAFFSPRNNPTTNPLDTVLTGLNFQTGNPALQPGAVLGFVVGVTFGTSNTTNAATLSQFTVDIQN